MISDGLSLFLVDFRPSVNIRPLFEAFFKWRDFDGRDRRVAVQQGEPFDIGLWVDAAPFRALLRHLMAVGAMSSDEVAALAGIPARLADRLLNGRNGRPLQRICPITAARLLLVSEWSVRAARRTTTRLAA